jgi:pilus assembly protein CpaB
MKPARLIILVIAIVAGGLAALLAGRTPGPSPAPPAPQLQTAEVMVAATDIPIGTRIAPQDLRWETWPAAAVQGLLRKSEHPDGIAQIAGSIARATFTAGEPIRDGKLIKGAGSYMAAVLSHGMLAASVEISPENGAGGFILPQDHVDVLLSRRPQQVATSKETAIELPAQSEIIISNVKVLAIDQGIEEKNGQRVVVGRTATLELTPSQTERLAQARQMGTVSLALRSLADFNAKPRVLGEDSKPANPNYEITVYRGSTRQSLKCAPAARPRQSVLGWSCD